MSNTFISNAASKLLLSGLFSFDANEYMSGWTDVVISFVPFLCGCSCHKETGNYRITKLNISSSVSIV